jgi:NADPH:quinone reductase-like Zn-dependent oxidoreductase
MKAMVYERYGTPDVIQAREIDRPELADDGMLVRVRAASVNPYDWHMLTGKPYLVHLAAGLRKPKNPLLGSDFSGTVESVGKDVDGFQPGDDVFGSRTGAFAEYVCVRKAVARKPPNVTFEEAAAVPIAAVTALQGLRDKGRLQPGQKVLVNGASGGVGTYAVQIAKVFGAEVTGVCRSHNVELVRSIGADHVVDYTQEDFTRSGEQFHVMLDIAGNRSWAECKRVLNEQGIMVIVGGAKTNRWIGPMGDALRRRLASSVGSRRVVAPFLAKLNKDDMTVMAELLESGKVKSVIDRRYELDDLPAALAYIGDGHARAKVVIAVP